MEARWTRIGCLPLILQLEIGCVRLGELTMRTDETRCVLLSFAVWEHHGLESLAHLLLSPCTIGAARPCSLEPRDAVVFRLLDLFPAWE